MTTIQACLNGVTARRQHPRVPYTPAELAEQAWAAVAAGACSLHIHPRDSSGRETFDAEHVAATLQAVRRACPGIPVGVSTGLWVTRGDANLRLALVADWTGDARPGFASVNVSEEGAGELSDALRVAGVGVEAGVWSVAEAHALVEGTMGRDFVRILVEPKEADPQKAVATAAVIARIVAASDFEVRQLHHGTGAGTWTIMRWAIARGYDIRIGLEDTTFLPDDRRCHDNRELVEQAVRELRHHENDA